MTTPGRSRGSAVWAIVFALVAAGCQNTGSLVVRDRVDPEIDFTRYRTYAQAPLPEPTSRAAVNEIEGRAIQRAIARGLEAHGLVPADFESADLHVAFTIDGGTRTEVWGSTWNRRLSTSHFVDGRLTLEVVDREADRLVWHGWAESQTLDDDFPPGTAERAVDKLLARFPEVAPPDASLEPSAASD